MGTGGIPACESSDSVMAAIIGEKRSNCIREDGANKSTTAESGATVASSLKISLSNVNDAPPHSPNRSPVSENPPPSPNHFTMSERPQSEAKPSSELSQSDTRTEKPPKTLEYVRKEDGREKAPPKTLEYVRKEDGREKVCKFQCNKNGFKDVLDVLNVLKDHSESRKQVDRSTGSRREEKVVALLEQQDQNVIAANNYGLNSFGGINGYGGNNNGYGGNNDNSGGQHGSTSNAGQNLNDDKNNTGTGKNNQPPWTNTRLKTRPTGESARDYQRLCSENESLVGFYEGVLADMKKCKCADFLETPPKQVVKVNVSSSEPTDGKNTDGKNIEGKNLKSFSTVFSNAEPRQQRPSGSSFGSSLGGVGSGAPSSASNSNQNTTASTSFKKSPKTSPKTSPRMKARSSTFLSSLFATPHESEFFANFTL